MSAGPTSPRRPFRLQFSLRALLVLMALVPVAIVIYRWPWEEQAGMQMLSVEAEAATEAKQVSRDLSPAWVRLSLKNDWGRQLIDGSDQTAIRYITARRTTYCRAWDGSIVKHGLETWPFVEDVKAENWFVDGELRQTSVHFPKTGDRETTRLVNGQPEGGYYCQAGARTWEGNLHAGKRTGPWRMTFRDREETVTAQLAYENDRAHGDWTWTNDRGEVLQTARFEQGGLVQWNGRAVEDESARWRQAQHVDPRIARLLTSNYEEFRFLDRERNLEYYFEFGSAARVLETKEGERLLIHSSWPEPQHSFLDLATRIQTLDQKVGEGLVAGSLLSSRLIVMRFDLICVVPICSRELNWVDRTGVMQVKFPARSFQAAYWNELRAAQIGRFGAARSESLGDFLQELFRESGIEFDLSALSVFDRGLPHDLWLPTHKRYRRDILGVLLASRGWSCEQRGNTLVLHPHPRDE